MKRTKLNPKTAGYYLISLFVSGVCGYISIGNLLNLSFLEIVKHPLLLFFIANTCLIIWVIYGLYTVFKKKQISIKNMFYSFVVLPLTVFALIGHLGNSDAITIVFGELLGMFYYYFLIGVYIYSIYLMVKNKKRG